MRKIKGEFLNNSEETAKKILEVWEVLSKFTDEDKENLRKARRVLMKQNDDLRSVGGILVDLDSADYKMLLNELRINRINALLALIESLGKEWEIGGEYLKKKKQSIDIEKIFGIG
ncbi:MAG: hypothetical protein KatS3mg096_787 [Candidatus Parcubacteria bacterium]|nr:MAG: hypothetical protein KatS3mg096_787 [Candidatus Parcubacteria bacterium]